MVAEGRQSCCHHPRKAFALLTWYTVLASQCEVTQEERGLTASTFWASTDMPTFTMLWPS